MSDNERGNLREGIYGQHPLHGAQRDRFKTSLDERAELDQMIGIDELNTGWL